MAGPFTREDFERLVPADKKLSPEWVKSLFERGTPEVFRGSELKFVGMPVGGIGAGQLYLGGDGRLWHWDIFNQFIFTGAGHYAKPMIPNSPLTQKFSLKLGDKIVSRDRNGFSDVSFRGEYPIGVVNYADANVPVAACGFEYHGPKQHLGFAPKLTPENFKCAFTSAEGWGSFNQKLESGSQRAEIFLRWGKLDLKTITLASEAHLAKVLHAGKSVAANIYREGKRILFTLKNTAIIPAGEKLNIVLA